MVPVAVLVNSSEPMMVDGRVASKVSGFEAPGASAKVVGTVQVIVQIPPDSVATPPSEMVLTGPVIGVMPAGRVSTTTRSWAVEVSAALPLVAVTV